MPERPEKRVDSAQDDGAGEDTESDEPRNVGWTGEIREVGGAATEEPCADEGFANVEESQNEGAEEALTAADEQASGELRGEGGTYVGDPALTGREEQVSEKYSIGDPYQIGFRGEANENRGQEDGEEAPGQAQSDVL